MCARKFEKEREVSRAATTTAQVAPPTSPNKATMGANVTPSRATSRRRRQRACGGFTHRFARSARAARAAWSPHIPCTPAPGGVEEEQR